ncbi:MAG: tetratricopeptide repeat protein [Fimbriiglobus sp.]
MSTALLVEAYNKLPQPQHGDDPDLLQAGMLEGMRSFRDAVKTRYNEGTLQRLLCSPVTQLRRAAGLALGLLGTMQSNPMLSNALRDEDTLVRKFSTDSLWEIWFRAGSPEENHRLQVALQLPDIQQTLNALNELIEDAAHFAEAFNQRGIIHYRRGDFHKSVQDCQSALRLNAYHFAAAAGMGQSYLRLNKPRSALRAFQQAIDMNPSIENVRDTVRGLEAALDESGYDHD